MVYILYLVLGFYIFYFILAIPLYSVFPFYSASPFYSVNKDQINFYLSSIRSCCSCSCFKSSSLVVVRCRLFVPAKCVRIKKLCKTHYKCYYTTMIYLNTHLFLCPPPSYPRKKNNYFLSTSHLVYPFQKKCCSVVLLTAASAYYVDNTMQCQKKKKKYNANGMVLHVL